MSNTTDQSKFPKLSLQEYLSLGYVYLILLGLISDVIYFKFLGINILSYSAISDVLMAPVNTLVDDLRIFALVVIVIIGAYFYATKLMPALHNRLKPKTWYQKLVKDMEKTDRTYEDLKTKKRFDFLLVFLTAVFLGLKIGAGTAIKFKLENNQIKPTHSIVFSDDSEKKVNIIEQNSSYLFIVFEGQSDINIMPIGSNVKTIKALK